MNEAIAGRAEQRKSPRYPATLVVDLREGGESRRLETVDVSRHGIFLATDAPPRERFLVQLTIHLPDGPLPATAFVSRAVKGTKTKTPGVGLQFFALAAFSKDRWDSYIFGLAGHQPPIPSTVPQHEPDRATFLIKLKSQERLLEFYDTHVKQGGLYMATPVLKETGAEVALIVIHPQTEEEFILTGQVSRVCREPPKGMEIKLQRLGDQKRARFREFITTGSSVEPAPKQLSPSDLALLQTLPPAFDPCETSETVSIDIMVDENALEGSEQFDWREVTDDMLVIDFDLAEWVDGEDVVDPPPMEAGDSKEPDTESLDITIEETEEVSQDLPPEEIEDRLIDQAYATNQPAIVDIDAPSEQGDVFPETETSEELTPDLPILEVDPSDEISIDVPRAEVTPEKPELEEDEGVTADLLETVRGKRPPMEVRVRCDECEADYGTVQVGAVNGVMGLIASRRVYWCPKEEEIVSVLRLNTSAERRDALVALGDHALGRPVSLRFTFEIADLAAAPRCPDCGGNVRVTELVTALNDTLANLQEEETKELEGVACLECSGESLVVHRK